MAILSSNVTTALVGLAGVVFGTLTGHYFNQKLNLRNSRKDILFKRKLEYFEKLAETIENNIKIYKNSLSSIKIKKSKKEISIIVLEMKEKREKFSIMASPLYLNTHYFSEKITEFVDIEKKIFNKFENLKKIKNKKLNLTEIENLVNSLKDKANELITKMKSEMKNE